MAEQPNKWLEVATPAGEFLPENKNKQEDWSSVATPANPSGMEKTRAFLQGASGAGVQSTSILTGTALGAAGGFAVGGPVGGAVGGALGAGLGNELGQMMRQTPRSEEMPANLRPYGVAGEVVGGGAPFAVAPVGIGMSGARVAEGVMTSGSGFGGFINRMLDFAKSNPKTFLASEVPGLTGSAIGGGVAEAYLPGNLGARVGAEVAGGFFNVSRIIAGGFSASQGVFNSVRQSLTKSGRTNAAARRLQEIVISAGEDPEKLSIALRNAGIVNSQLTSAQKSGSPALAAIEARLAQESAVFGREQAKRAQDGLDAIKDMMIALRSTGDPSALRAAAELERNLYKTTISARLAIAEKSAVEATARITQNAPKERAAISRHADEILNQALADVRAVERELWEKIPREIDAGTSNLVSRYKELRNELLPNESMPAIIEGYIKTVTKPEKTGAILDSSGNVARVFALGDNPNKTNSGDLLRFRSRALDLARDAAAKGDMGDARRYGMLAEAALDDLSALPVVTENLTSARTFSRELHDTFTRTFADDATATARGGRDKLPPELTLRAALGGGKEQGALRLRQIEEAMKFLPSRGLGGEGAEANLNAMIDLQNRTLRIAASESIDPNTGKVSTTRLAKFIRDNGELIDRFPDVRRDLNNALTKEKSLQDLQRTLTDASAVVEKQAAFAKFSNTSNPANVVRSAVTSDNPAAELKKLSVMASRGGQDAVDGLKASVWDDAIRRSSDQFGNVSVERLYANMFKPMSPNQPSLIDSMVSQKIITPREKQTAELLFKEYQKIESAVIQGKSLDQLVREVSPVYDLAVRIAGAKLGSEIHGGGAGALVAAQRGSSFARNLFEKVPLTKTRDILIQAALDPRFASMLLEKPISKSDGVRLFRQIHAYMFQAGLTALEGDNE